MLAGRMQAQVNAEKKRVATGDIIHVPRGERYRLTVNAPYVRYALVCSTPYLEERIDLMTREQAGQARLNLTAN